MITGERDKYGEVGRWVRPRSRARPGLRARPLSGVSTVIEQGMYHDGICFDGKEEGEGELSQNTSTENTVYYGVHFGVISN